MTLRLVPPPGEGPPGRRKGGPRAASLSLTSDEVRHLRAAVTAVARSYGGKAGLARALGCDPGILSPGRRKLPHPGLAVALWRLTGLPLDVILRGKLAAVPTPRKPDPDDVA
jgi:hypothetical protein